MWERFRPFVNRAKVPDPLQKLNPDFNRGRREFLRDAGITSLKTVFVVASVLTVREIGEHIAPRPTFEPLKMPETVEKTVSMFQKAMSEFIEDGAMDLFQLLGDTLYDEEKFKNLLTNENNGTQLHFSFKNGKAIPPEGRWAPDVTIGLDGYNRLSLFEFTPGREGDIRHSEEQINDSTTFLPSEYKGLADNLRSYGPSVVDNIFKVKPKAFYDVINSSALFGSTRFTKDQSIIDAQIIHGKDILKYYFTGFGKFVFKRSGAV